MGRGRGMGGGSGGVGVFFAFLGTSNKNEGCFNDECRKNTVSAPGVGVGVKVCMWLSGV